MALAELGGVLSASDDLADSRVVVFSDLGSECGGDLCDAAEMLVDSGARLDFVVLGDAAPPACFDSLTPAEPEPDDSLVQDPPVFRVVAYDPGPSASRSCSPKVAPTARAAAFLPGRSRSWSGSIPLR